MFIEVTDYEAGRPVLVHTGALTYIRHSDQHSGTVFVFKGNIVLAVTESYVTVRNRIAGGMQVMRERKTDEPE